MTRSRLPDRLSTLVEHAARVFLSKGYRQTQMSDIARSLGVAPGTVYLYVESKETLFDLVMRHALGTVLPAQTDLPIQRTSEAALLKFFEESLEKEMRFPALEAAPPTATPARARAELEAVVRELFQKTSQTWLALKLLEKSAADWPELATLWFETYRPRIFRQMAEYVSRRMKSGVFRPAPDPVAAARLILEIIAAMAMHCRAETPPGQYDATLMEDLVADAIVHAYALPAGYSKPARKTPKGSK